jgi:hypothetical protein
MAEESGRDMPIPTCENTWQETRNKMESVKVARFIMNIVDLNLENRVANLKRRLSI